MELSDCKKAQFQVAEWKSATTISGALCVRILGVLLILEWLADSWDILLLELLHFLHQIFLMALDRSGWTMWIALVLKAVYFTVTVIFMEATTVNTIKMLVWHAVSKVNFCMLTES